VFRRRRRGCGTIETMDRDALRAAQTPLRDRYKADPSTAWTPLHAEGDYRDDGISCTVDTFIGPVRAGLHAATGGTGEDACSGDMLLQALVACAGVTLRSVATSMGLNLGNVHVRADGHFDARGTLGLDRTVEVGIAPITLTASVEADLDEATMTRLAASTERYCVVGQSLRRPPTIVVRRHGA
jgi:uncharacterized OsmC-like protein